ncbi:sensor histidine kinase [Paenibacillus sp. KQZ6P-2]|uniref:Sensor histidine kinase n=1 Tax=Paenibacillus mangrovi TaxID=2931978 RepID=A0A9X2B766_9BACL|nr:sensor histidine kinase [Paenibacillus mangrovi]MCJ8013428.1 sensor histidine kinase [Paenibacillus mangrovi]
MGIFKRYRIGHLFFGCFAGGIAVIFLIVIGVSYQLSANAIVSNTTGYQQKILDGLNKRLISQFGAINEMSLAISRENQLQEFLRGEGDAYTRFRKSDDMRIWLSNISFSMPIVNSIFLYMDSPPASNFQEPAQFFSLDEADESEWYKSGLNSDFFWIGQHAVMKGTQEVQVISFARKVIDITGRYRALLVLNVKAEDIQSIIRENGEYNRLLFDTGGRLITSVGDPGILMKAEDYVRVTQGNSGIKGSQVSKGEFGNRSSLLVWSQLFGSDWLLIEVTPWKQLTTGSLHIARVLMIIGIISIILVIFLTYFLTSQFTQPIYKLIRGMSAFPSSSKKPHLPEGYRNEFGLLFNGYKKLTKRIEELYRSLAEQSRRQKEVEMQALQAMINPHFLYNTLDQVNWLAIEAGQEQISRILELIGKMFRIGLSNGEGFIPIRDEMMHLACYVEIQNIRMGERIKITMDIEDGLDELYTPKLTLQPFVENSIMHGFHGKTDCLLEICARRKDGQLVFTIADNGVGIRPDWESMKPRKTGGYGIRNVIERLETYFGKPYGVTIEGLTTGGTTVTIRIPALANKPVQGGTFSVQNRNY